MNDPKVSTSQPAVLPSAHVRFTREEYHRLRKDQLLTGQSIPWLLKATYFDRADFTPTLDLETREAVRRELSYIGNNLNQAARHLHSGMFDDYKAKFDEVYQTFLCLRSFLGIVAPKGTQSNHGNRKNSL